MLRYLVRRALFMVFVLFVVSLLTFLIFVKLPSGDPARRAAGKSSTPEQIALPGVGAPAVDSIRRPDFPMVMGIMVLGALFIAVANLIVDVAYAALDPRVRYT